MLVLKDFKRAEGNCCVPTPGLFSLFLDPIASPVEPFHVFFEVPCSNAQVSALSAGLPWGSGTWQDACVEPPVLVLLHLFHKSAMLLPVFSWWPAGTLLLDALSRALSSSAAEHHVFTQATILAEAWDFLHMVAVESDPLFFSGCFSDCQDHFEFCPCLQDTCKPL